ncbi:MAG TPA: exodeoxyribonuclease VII large subunit [bacterium]|nr:exodeoxyribonuclease VII large subunit [bacterium]
MKIWKIAELNNYCKNLLESQLHDIDLEGEISNFKRHTSGHLYFTLKDADAQINAVMYRYKASTLPFSPKDGDKVLAKGTVSVFPMRGQFQFLCWEMKPLGVGDLQKKFEELKKKLEKEGLFNPERKRPLPVLPQKIGVITSPTGAAIRDILNVINRRFANVEILLYPVQVQGTDAKNQIAEAIENMNLNFPDVDVIISGRGGGSLEDLWAYNEEIVARAIFASRIPIISAVGHEIDFTISDFVADLRAPTPSAAAELVVKNKEELKNRIQSLSSHLGKSLWMLYKNTEHRLRIIMEKKVLKHPELAYLPFFQKLEYVEEKLQLKIKELVEDCGQRLNLLREKVNLLSPMNILSRGYAIAYTLPDKKILKSSSDVNTDDSILVKLKEGEIECAVKRK